MLQELSVRRHSSASLSLSRQQVRKLIGVKSYPRGVTTNSDGGIESYETYYPVFAAMEEAGMVLNLHGEVPSDPSSVRPTMVVLRENQ